MGAKSIMKTSSCDGHMVVKSGVSASRVNVSHVNHSKCFWFLFCTPRPMIKKKKVKTQKEIFLKTETPISQIRILQTRKKKLINRGFLNSLKVYFLTKISLIPPHLILMSRGFIYKNV